ncbi:MAG TPA: SAM-dependent methyltransferase [Chthoniobacteraceae bacterium]|jgi:SAM-dependent methyltransferase
MILEKLRAALDAGTFVKLTLSQPAPGAEPELRNLYARVVDLREGRALSLLFRYAKRDVTKNVPLAEAPAAIEAQLGATFERAHLFTTSGDWQWRADRPEKLKASRPVFAQAPESTHDHAKARVVESAAPFLQALGVTNAAGEARPGMVDKLRQIHRFVEILDHLLEESSLREARKLRMVDMGAGKGYLTFAAYAAAQKRGIDLELTGVEARDDLVKLTNAVAQRVDFTGLRFVQGQIDSFQPETPPDVLIALHACNTATDDALFRGICAEAALIVAAPCCHQEVRPQLVPPAVLQDVLRHGILREREAEIVTDAIRALLLEIHGYRANVFEFISPEHTGKNLMISAQRRATPVDPAPARARLRELLDFYGIREQRLARLLGEL